MNVPTCLLLETSHFPLSLRGVGWGGVGWGGVGWGGVEVGVIWMCDM